MARNNTDILPLFQKHIRPYDSTNADVITDNSGRVPHPKLCIYVVDLWNVK